MDTRERNETGFGVTALILIALLAILAGLGAGYMAFGGHVKNPASGMQQDITIKPAEGVKDVTDKVTQ